MSPKHFFFTPEGHPGTSNLDSRTGGEAITVTPNFPSKPDRQELFLGISMDWSGAEPGEAWAAVDADELRDAIDKAVGPREEEADWRDSNRVEITWGGERITVGRENFVTLSNRRDEELTLLLELWSEQRRLGASDEALAATRTRIEQHIKEEA